MKLDINVNVNFQAPALSAILAQLLAIGGKIVGLFDDLKASLDVLGGSVDKAIARVRDDVSGLTDKIAELQADLDDDDGLTADQAAEVQAKIAELQAKIDALDPISPSTLPEAPEE